MSNTKITVVDSIMGSGKTSKMIDFINESPKDDKFIYITPFLTEVARVKEKCKQRKFKDPTNKGKGKKDNFMKMVAKGENIVATHALFQGIGLDDIDAIKIQGYILIMDEVMNVVEQLHLNKNDMEVLTKCEMIRIEDGGKVLWNKPEDYDTKYNDVRNMAITDSLFMVNNTLLVWAFPVPIFDAFVKTYVLTYLFDGQVQKYYYDLFALKYEYVSVDNVDGKFEFVEYRKRDNMDKIRSLINIDTDEKLNRVGLGKYTLSKSFYLKHDKEVCDILKTNTYNFFRNKCKSKSEDNMWATFKDYKVKCSGKGYSKGFISLGARSTNEYIDKKYLAYLANVFLNPFVSKFFIDRGVTVDEDIYALSELLQWIWRSQIRRGDEIVIYIPSERMRGLLFDYLG